MIFYQTMRHGANKVCIFSMSANPADADTAMSRKEQQIFFFQERSYQERFILGGGGGHLG